MNSQFFGQTCRRMSAMTLIFAMIAQLIITAPTAQAAGLDNNTLLLLHLDEEIASSGTIDASSAGHTFVQSNTTASPIGKFGNARQFGVGGMIGEDDGIKNIDIGNRRFTIDVWLQPPSQTTFNGLLDGTSYSVISDRTSFWKLVYKKENNTTLGVQFQISGVTLPLPEIQIAASASLNQWQHIALIRNTDSNTISLFINGVKKVSNSLEASVTLPLSEIRIGSPNGGANAPIGSLIDEVRISDVDRTTDVHDPLYVAGSCATGQQCFNPPTKPYSQNEAPTITAVSAPTISTANQTAYPITCSGISDPDGDLLTVEYSFNNGTNWYPLDTVTSVNYTPNPFTLAASVDLTTINPIGYAGADTTRTISCHVSDGLSIARVTTDAIVVRDTTGPTIASITSTSVSDTSIMMGTTVTNDGSGIGGPFTHTFSAYTDSTCQTTPVTSGYLAAGVTSYTFSTGLAPNATYYFTARAKDSVGNEGIATNCNPSRTLASAPTDVIGSNATTVTDNQILLSWHDPAAGTVTDYQLEQQRCSDTTWTDLTAGTRIAASVEARTVTGLSAATCYRFRLTPYNTAHMPNDIAARISPDITTSLATPTNVRATIDSETTIDWAWDTVADATSYAIYRDDGDANYVDDADDILLNATNETTWHQTTIDGTADGAALQPNTIYNVYVRATSTDGGTSTKSVSVTTYTDASVPTLSVATSVQPTSIDWMWMSSGSADCASTIGVSEDCDTTNTSHTGWVTTKGWSRNGLTSNTLDTIFVRARNGDTPPESTAWSPAFSRYTAIETPSAPTLTSDTNAITATIAAVSSGMTNAGLADIQFTQSNTTSDPLPYERNIDGFSWTNSGLTPNTEYTYVARARNANDIPNPTPSAEAQIFTRAITPAAPIIGATTRETTRLSLSLGSTGASVDTRNPDGTMYCVQRSTSIDGSGALAGTIETLTSRDTTSNTNAWTATTDCSNAFFGWNASYTILIANLTPNTTYFFRVKARNHATSGYPSVETEWSHISSSSTKADTTGVSANRTSGTPFFDNRNVIFSSTHFANGAPASPITSYRYVWNELPISNVICQIGDAWSNDPLTKDVPNDESRYFHIIGCDGVNAQTPIEHFGPYHYFTKPSTPLAFTTSTGRLENDTPFTLTWTASSRATTYAIREVNGTRWSNENITPTEATCATDDDTSCVYTITPNITHTFEANKSYAYQLIAINAADASTPTPRIAVTKIDTTKASVANGRMTIVGENLTLGSTSAAGRAELPAGITAITLPAAQKLDLSAAIKTKEQTNDGRTIISVDGGADAATIIDLGNFTSPTITTAIDIRAAKTIGDQTVTIAKATKLQSGTDGADITLTSTETTTAQVSLPDDITVFASAGWDGTITPPRTVEASGTAPSGYTLGTSIIEVGSSTDTIILDQPAEIILDGIFTNVGYLPAGSTTWQAITNVCDDYDHPTSPIFPGECAITDGTTQKTKIVTYHFTTFGELITRTVSTVSSGGGSIVRAVTSTWTALSTFVGKKLTSLSSKFEMTVQRVHSDDVPIQDVLTLKNPVHNRSLLSLIGEALRDSLTAAKTLIADFEVGDRVATNDRGGATVTFSQMSDVRMDKNTDVELANIVEQDDHVGMHFRQRSGQAWYKFKSSPNKQNIHEVATSSTVATIRGTSINVESFPDGREVYTLAEGHMTVTDRTTGKTTDLDEGDRYIHYRDGAIDILRHAVAAKPNGWYAENFKKDIAFTDFSDVKKTDWFYTYATNLRQLGIVTGKKNNTFAPHDELTRAEVVKIALASQNIEPSTYRAGQLSDVQKNDWYAGYIATAVQRGIAQGYDDDTFHPNQYITRAEAITIFLKAAGVDSSRKTRVAFADVPTSAWFAPYVAIAKDAGIINGYRDRTFRPANTMTRAEAAKIIIELLRADV